MKTNPKSKVLTSSKVPKNLNITAQDYQILSQILEKYPTNFFFFGSRTTFKNKPSSDLDIYYENLSLAQLFNLQQDFSDSDLPFFVDLVAYHKIPFEYLAFISNQKIS